MRMVTAIIQPFKLDDVVLALEEIPGFPGMTVTDARGFGRDHLEGPHDRAEDLSDFRRRVRVEIVVDDEMTARVVETLRCAAHTGRRGDGEVIVWSVDRTYDIRCLDEEG